MKILISDIPIEGVELEFCELIESEEVGSPVEAKLKIDKNGKEIIISGTLKTNLKLTCSRCLVKYFKELLVPINVVYQPVEELKSDENYELKTEELDMDFYKGDELDLNLLLKEQITLNIPMKPLCAEDCKGICIRCGQDLNIERCKCESIYIDPRLEKLKILLDKYN